MRTILNNRQRVWAAALTALVVTVGAAAESVHQGSSQTSGIASHDATTAAAIGSAKDLSRAFRFAADKVLPSVVTIENRPTIAWKSDDEGAARDRSSPQGENPFKGTPFERMFPDLGPGFRNEGPNSPGDRSGGMGSGVIVDPSGLIMTNNHVVSGGGDVTVRLQDGREFKAVNVWADPKTDIAVVKIDGATDLVAATIGNSDAVEIGDWVLALGQPFGLESTVTAGIISAKHRGIGITARENFLQTDAAINPGNSGGPLVNLEGEVVGINTAISSRSGGNDGIGFAVPINLAKWVANQLAGGGTVHRAYLGIGIQPVTAQLALQFHVKPREGVVVTDVFPNTPAAKAGLQSGDVIVEFAGIRIDSPQQLQDVVERSELMKSHPLQIVRDGKQMQLTFVAEEQPGDFGTTTRGGPQGSSRPSASRLNNLGLEISTLEPAVADQLGLKETSGVVITAVQEGSPAERAGLEAGMVITQVNRKPVANVADAKEAISHATSDEAVLLLVRSENGSRFVALKP
jgi:serine protease Do